MNRNVQMIKTCLYGDDCVNDNCDFEHIYEFEPFQANMNLGYIGYYNDELIQLEPFKCNNKECKDNKQKRIACVGAHLEKKATPLFCMNGPNCHARGLGKCKFAHFDPDAWYAEQRVLEDIERQKNLKKAKPASPTKNAWSENVSKLVEKIADGTKTPDADDESLPPLRKSKRAQNIAVAITPATAKQANATAKSTPTAKQAPVAKQANAPTVAKQAPAPAPKMQPKILVPVPIPAISPEPKSSTSQLFKGNWNPSFAPIQNPIPDAKINDDASIKFVEGDYNTADSLKHMISSLERISKELENDRAYFSAMNSVREAMKKVEKSLQQYEETSLALAGGV